MAGNRPDAFGRETPHLADSFGRFPEPPERQYGLHGMADPPRPPVLRGSLPTHGLLSIPPPTVLMASPMMPAYVHMPPCNFNIPPPNCSIPPPISNITSLGLQLPKGGQSCPHPEQVRSQHKPRQQPQTKQGLPLASNVSLGGTGTQEEKVDEFDVDKKTEKNIVKQHPSANTSQQDDLTVHGNQEESQQTSIKIQNTPSVSNTYISERATREFVTPKTPRKSRDCKRRKTLRNPKSDEERLSSIGKNKATNKPTLLYAIVSDLKINTDYEDYLRQRVGQKYSNYFEVRKTEVTTISPRTERECLKVTLYFRSRARAMKIRGALLNSNKNYDTKLWVSFDDVDKSKLELLYYTEMRSRLDRHRAIMFERCVQVLEIHESKMLMMRDEQTELQKLLKVGGLSSTEFDRTKAESTTIDEKLSEFKLHKAEFEAFTENMHEKLNDIANSSKLDTEINKLRKDVEIECSRLNNALPIYARRSDILEAVKNYQVTVLVGETGSGKSTQITQYLLQAGYAKDGLIVCTQPRKVAAVTLATHVSHEMASNVGQVIGYHVGIKSKRTDLTKVLYVTDHILLKECLKDNALKKFSCIIIDEAHERTIFTDLALGMIKSAMEQRPSLKVIITSATINPDIFVSYFGGNEICPVLRVSGRTFPVEDIFCKPEHDKHSFEEYANAAVKKSLELHHNNLPASGNILVFVTTPAEVEKCCDRFVSRCTDGRVQCLPLHGKLKADEQAKVFLDNPPNKRKVVFATNCAETSITIPGVQFVVDTGLEKGMKYDPKRKINSLRVHPISQSSAEQRRGRAGRTAPGKCYRLYSKTTYNSMKTTSEPEILRVHLGRAILQLMDLGVNPLSFDFVEAPTQEAIDAAMESLTDIGAVAEGNITDVGRWLSKLPIEPRKAYLVKLGIDEGIPMESIIVAVCGGVDMFYRFGTEEEKKAADEKKLKFSQNGGDVLTKLNVYREWGKIPEKQRGKWCFDNYINAKSIRGVRELVNEIRTILKKEMNQDIPYALNLQSEIDSVLKRILLRVLKQNICVYLGHEKAGFYDVHNQQCVQVHPSSVLKLLNIQSNIIVYEDHPQTSRDFITGITVVDEGELCKLSPDMLISYQATIENMCVSLVGAFCFGKMIIRSLHIDRAKIETQLNKMSRNKIAIIDVNRERGEIQLFAHKSDKQRILRQLQHILTTLTIRFQPSPEVLISYQAAIENICMSLVGTFCFGNKITKSLHTDREKIEKQLNKTSENKIAIIDVNRERGEIQLFTYKSDKQRILLQLQHILSKRTMCFQQRCKTLKFGKSDGVTFVLGAGCMVKDVLMPQNFKDLKIKKTNFSAGLATSITVQKEIFEAIKADYIDMIQFITTTFPSVNVGIRRPKSKSGKISINIEASDPTKLAQFNILVHDILQGDTLECRRNNELLKLFTKDGRAAMRAIEKDIGSVIFVDNRTMSVIVRGSQKRRTRSLLRINQYLDGIAGLAKKVILLKGGGKPPGLMKEIVLNYLEKMNQLPGILSISLHYMKQRMTILGEKSSIDETMRILQKASRRVQNISSHTASDFPNCSVCFSSIEPDDMYRVECCGHPYCKECIKQQIRSAVQYKTFPVVCASEKCGQPFIVDDLASLILQGWTTYAEVMKASVSDFVSKNKTSYHYCITPGCDMIYEITHPGLLFTCSLCLETMCTSCHVQYHNGLLCQT